MPPTDLPAGASRAALAATARDESARWRRFAAWVSRTGVLRTTILLASACSLGSLLLTWLALRLSGHASMGSALWISLLVPLPLTLGFGSLCLFLVASLDQAWARVNAMAQQDSLTGLLNRRGFVTLAQRELDLAQRHGQPLAVLLMDVDHFKSINDAFGHLSGDKVLIEIANRCQGALRSTDLLGRWGGEEFIMLLPNTPLTHARQFAERVREAIVAAPQVRIGEREVRVSASLGAAGNSPGQPCSLDELIDRADTAMYQAKSDGRDRVAVSDPDQPPAPTKSPLAPEILPG